MSIAEFIQSAKEKLTTDEAEPIEPEEGELVVGEEMLPPDPRPHRKERSRRAPAPKVTATTKREIRDAITMMITLPASTLMFRDPICAGAVLENVDNIADKLVPIICRNPALLRWFTDGAGYMDWLALASAMAPVARTIWAHHVTHSIDLGGEDEDAVDISQYSAPVYG